MVPSPTPTCAWSPSHYFEKNPAAAVSWPLALLGLFLLVFALVTLSSPGRIDIYDGQTRYEVARSLVDHGDSIIRDKASWFLVFEGRDGQKYSSYRIPQSALGVVAIHVADATGPVSEARRQFFFALISPCLAALLATVYAFWFRALGHRPGASLAWGAAGIFCTPSWYYGTSTFDDMIGTFCAVAAVAVAWLSRGRRPVLGAAVAGVAMAWAVNCKPPLLLFALPVLAAGYRPQLSWRRQLLRAGLVGVGILGGACFFQMYHAYKFPPGTTDVYAEYIRLHGNLSTTNPFPGLAGLAFSPACGVLWYCPTLFLSWRGWRVWREEYPGFCLAVIAASLMFAVSICFLPYFKGDPCWGPRYLTPVFALAWVFVPAAVGGVRVGTAKIVLALGLAVQLLGLSVDPLRLFMQLPLRWNYFNDNPWLVFNGQISHLLQRPREIVEVLTPRDTPPAEFNPAPLPTHAGGIIIGSPPCISITALMAAPGAPGPLNGTLSIWPTIALQQPALTKLTLDHYQIFNSPRPWVFSQRYLAPAARPVDLGGTIGLLASLGLAGFVLQLVGTRWSLLSRDLSRVRCRLTIQRS
jgi:hypothetical protein